jgi:hypothetical protein
MLWRAVFGVCCSLRLLLGLGSLVCCCSMRVMLLDITDHNKLHAGCTQRVAALAQYDTAQHSGGILSVL